MHSGLNGGVFLSSADFCEYQMNRSNAKSTSAFMEFEDTLARSKNFDNLRPQRIAAHSPSTLGKSRSETDIQDAKKSGALPSALRSLAFLWKRNDNMQMRASPQCRDALRPETSSDGECLAFDVKQRWRCRQIAFQKEQRVKDKRYFFWIG